MSLTVKQLNKRAVNQSQIDSVIRDQLKIIDNKILSTQVNWGRNTASFVLPCNLQFQGLDKRDAQRIVYHGIIKSLRKRGFEIELLTGDSKSTIFISWVTGMDDEDLDEMDKYIKKHLIAEPPQQPRPPSGHHGVGNPRAM